MKFFKKKDRVLDLTKNYKKKQEQIMPASSTGSDTEASPLGSAFSMFGDSDSSSSSSSDSSSDEYVDFSASGDEKKKRLAKRLVDMTDRLEDLSNQIYHLQQRIEVMERKMGVGGY
ncbi:hypothetical protein ACFLZJ_02160 [Nanoarchaeota archaeon]